MARQPLIDPDLLQRYVGVVLINRDRGSWSQQNDYERGFWAPNYRLTESTLRQHLRHKLWVGCRAPANGTIDRIGFDIDADTSELGSRNQRYWRVRELIGLSRRPVVWQTPSGAGLRVYYRVPHFQIEELIESWSDGLLPDVLRAAGLPVARGELEVFPQRNFIDRLPLGRRMPILDPNTLEPLPHAAMGDAYDADVLRGGVDALEEWYQHPHTDLHDHLKALKRVPRPTNQRRTKSGHSPIPPVESHDVATPETFQRLVNRGLTAPNTRQRVEWHVGRAFILHPITFRHYGLTGAPSKTEVAWAIARWLANHHNGKSKDWTTAVRRLGSEEEAVRYFAESYLRPNAAEGLSTIDRLARSVGKYDSSLRLVAELSRAERHEMLAVASRHFKPGAMVYKFECWLFAWLRAVKHTIFSPRRRGGEPTPVVEAGGRVVEVELSAEWMLGWPYGSGRDSKTREARYVDFARILREESLMIPTRRFQSPTYGKNREGVATTYRVPEPNLLVRVRDLDATPEAVSRAIDGLYGYGHRPMHPAEAHHALHVVTAGIDLRRRYGRDAARRIQTHYQTIKQGLEDKPPTGTSESARVTSELQ